MKSKRRRYKIIRVASYIKKVGKKKIRIKGYVRRIPIIFRKVKRKTREKPVRAKRRIVKFRKVIKRRKIFKPRQVIKPRKVVKPRKVIKPPKVQRVVSGWTSSEYVKNLVRNTVYYDFSTHKLQKVSRVRFPKLPPYYYPKFGYLSYDKKLPKHLKGEAVIWFLVSIYELNTPRLLRARKIKYKNFRKVVKQVRFERTLFAINYKKVKVNLLMENLPKILKKFYEQLNKDKSFIKNRKGLLTNTRNYGLDIWFVNVEPFGVIGLELI